MNNRSGIVLIIAVAIVLIAFYRWDDIRASVNYLATQAVPGTTPSPTPAPMPEPTPQDRERMTDEPALAASPETSVPAANIQRQERRPSDKCMDGSRLTVTGRDANQINYKCESGAVGAFTN